MRALHSEEAVITSTDSLKLKTFRGSVSLGTSTIGLRIFSVFTSIILARLLSPSAFGQVALAQVVLSIVALLSTLGLPTAVIQTPLDRSKAAFSALAINTVAAAVVCGGIMITAPWLGFLLGDPQVEPVLQLLSLTILLGGVTRVPEALIQKDLLFGRLSIMGIITEIVTVGVSIGLAWKGWGVWSLVYGAIAGAIANAVVAWLFLPSVGWVRLANWDRGIVKQIAGFGMRIVGSASVYSLYSYTDNYVVGRVLGTESLGFYSRAVDLTSKTVDSINRIIGVVLFPSYAKVQDDKERLSRAYLKSLRMIALLTIPIAGGLFAVAEELIVVLLGKEWAPAVPALKVLTFMSLLKPLSSTTSALFISTGFPEYNLRAGLVVTAALLIGIFVFLSGGLVGVAAAVVFAHAVGLVYNVYQVQSILPRTVVKMGEAVLPVFVACVIMVIGVFGVRMLLVAFQSTSLTIPSLILLVVTGMVVYGAVLAIIQRPLLGEIWGLIRSKRSPIVTESEA
jgi:O-antigen/teichoic acid export membrane protein